MRSVVTVNDSHVHYDPVTIADSTDTSDAIDLGDRSLVGLRFEADVTNTSFTILTSRTLGGDYVEVRNSADGTAKTLTVAATATGEYYIDAGSTVTGRFIKIKGALSESGEANFYAVSRVI